MNADLGNIKDFEKHDFVKHFIKMLNPSGWVVLPFMIPGLGDLMDKFDVQISIGPQVRWFRQFINALMEQQRNNESGRAKNFLNIFASNKIADKEAETATKVLLAIIYSYSIYYIPYLEHKPIGMQRFFAFFPIIF